MILIVIASLHHHFDDATTKITWIFLKIEVIERKKWSECRAGGSRKVVIYKQIEVIAK